MGNDSRLSENPRKAQKFFPSNILPYMANLITPKCINYRQQKYVQVKNVRSLQGMMEYFSVELRTSELQYILYM